VVGIRVEGADRDVAEFLDREVFQPPGAKVVRGGRETGNDFAVPTNTVGG
jgi:hypothetical protein